MSKENNLYDIPHTRVQKISLDNAGDAEQMKKFQFAFAKLMEDYQVTHVQIKGRALKGKFSGGPIGFKIEAALQMKFAAAIIATVAANRYDSMNEDDLLVNLESTLSSALSSEARGDADAAVAKTAAIKNIQKALTARILKRLDDGQPLVEVARKMKAIEGMQP
jgi:hypothetical protein